MYHNSTSKRWGEKNIGGLSFLCPNALLTVKLQLQSTIRSRMLVKMKLFPNTKFNSTIQHSNFTDICCLISGLKWNCMAAKPFMMSVYHSKKLTFWNIFSKGFVLNNFYCFYFLLLLSIVQLISTPLLMVQS